MIMWMRAQQWDIITICIYIMAPNSRAHTVWKIKQMAGFDFDQGDLFNDRIEIAEECSIKDIEFPEALLNRK